MLAKDIAFIAGITLSMTSIFIGAVQMKNIKELGEALEECLKREKKLRGMVYGFLFLLEEIEKDICDYRNIDINQGIDMDKIPEEVRKLINEVKEGKKEG